MSEVFHFLLWRWPALAFLGAAVVLALLWLRRGHRSPGLLLASSTLALAGSGGLVLPAAVGAWLAAGAAFALALLLAVVILTDRWWAPLGYGAGAVLLLGLGAMAARPVGQGLVRAGQFLLGLEPLQPWWLLVLLSVPLVVWLSFRSLAGLGPVRRWLAIGLRCLLITLLALALAETHARHRHEGLTVLFLWDRSFSMPREIEGGEDIAEKRLRRFINDAVELRGPGHERDRAGVIVFARQPRLELPPAVVPRLGFTKTVSRPDETYTDIAAALKLALACFPEGTGKRIVLVSDGNQNLGNAEEQARIARQNGVQIDVVPVISGQQRQQEVLVERVEAPSITEKGARLPIRIVLRSYHPQVVVGKLKLFKVSMELRKAPGEAADLGLFEEEAILDTTVRLRQGLNTFFFQDPAANKEESYTYQAVFVPQKVQDDRGRLVQEGLPGDRVENNRASTNVVARGQRFVLLVEPEAGAHKLLARRLQEAKSSLKVVAVTPGQLPRNADQLALILSRFDCVILANIPAESLSEEQQQVIRSNTHDQGCGLIMVGGPQGFGSGGWQGTEVEKALPVTCDLQSTKVEGKNGLVLIMHASEMAEGNFWQKKIARLAIEKLSPLDMVGLIYYAWGGAGGGHTWHVPFRQIGQHRREILRLLDSMEPGDMPDAEPPLRMAHDALSDAKHQLGARHIIFISDGDHWEPPEQIGALRRIRAARITLTTVCITTHGAAEVAKMKKLADLVGNVGKRKSSAYHVTNPNQLPEIYIKESRLISQSFVYDKTFAPQLRLRGGPTEGLPKELSPLHGFVRTTPRPSPLVEIPIETPKIGGHQFPILAYWHYGLGKAVAFTSDARTHPAKDVRYWDHDWAVSEMHGKFWEQVVTWSLRAVETGKHLTLTTEQRDGKVKVIIDARDDKVPLVGLELRGGITAPAFKVGDPRLPDLKFEEKNSGVYEAEFKAEDVGAYFIHVRATWKKDGKEMSDSVRGGVTIPYSPEFAEMESNPALLEWLRDLTGGRTIADDEAALAEAARSGTVFRPLPARSLGLQPIWHWLVVLAAIGLFFDVAVRRITVEPAKAVAAAQALWARLRGRARAEQTPQLLDRLQSRKAQVEEARDRERAGRRFVAGEAPAAVPPPEEARPTVPQPPAPAPPAVKKEEEAGDYASRLLRAKKRVWKDREKEP
jgi:uncharacterized membrane protein